jgi:hypothetical protein
MANLESESMSVGRIFVRSVVIGNPGETRGAAAGRIVNACVLESPTAEQGAVGQLLEKRRT